MLVFFNYLFCMRLILPSYICLPALENKEIRVGAHLSKVRVID